MQVPRPVSIFVLTIVISAAAVWIVILFLFPGTWSCPLCMTKEEGAERQLRSFGPSIQSFSHVKGRLPESLGELVKPDAEHGRPGGYFDCDEIPIDPWGLEFRYFLGDCGCVVLSAGRDMVVGTDDDLLKVFGTR